MEKTVPAQAASCYNKVIEGYKSRLRNEPDLKLSDYCRESHTYCHGVIGWMKSQGISIHKLRREASDDAFRNVSASGTAGTFIQFDPAPRPSSSNLRGVSITFPDGVNLTLQESSVEGLVSLLTIYQSRHGGAKSCSD